MKLKLEIRIDDEQSFTWETTKATIRVGRDPRSELALKGDRHDNVSWSHCLIELKPGGMFVTDLKSTNGVYRNGKQVNHRGMVRAGDKISLGEEGPVLKVLELNTEPEQASQPENGTGAVDLDKKRRAASPARVAGLWNRCAAAFSQKRNWTSLIAAVVLLVVLVGLFALLGRNGGDDHADGKDSPEKESSVASAASRNGDGDQSIDPLARQAHDILRRNCFRCHGQPGQRVRGGVNYILNRDALVEHEKVIPGDADGSDLIQFIEDGYMPPEEEQPQPSEAELGILRQWIDAGASDFEAAPSTATAPTSQEFVSNTQVLRMINDDLQKVDERQRRFMRYFTLTHLFNAGTSEAVMQDYRHALSKLINSLSWKREIKPPESVDPAKTILRIDLRSYDWNEQTWDEIIAANPYGVQQNNAAARACAEQTGSELPFVRGDWFVFAAARPPLYHTILRIPETDAALEIMLGINVTERIQQESARRAGFNQSGVSQNNRIIERHDSPHGAYWKSYDFSANTGRKNIFKHARGPESVMPAGLRTTAFQHDGGEIIFNLPNGLQAYMLTDEKGNRINKGPTAIVADDKQPDRAVLNGISCMSCHFAGMREKDDEIRDIVLANKSAFTDAEDILALYPPKEEMRDLIRLDAERFAAAVKQTGLAEITPEEPIFKISARFEAELDLKLAAAEAGLRPEELADGIKSSPKLGRALGPLLKPDGTVKRDAYREVFGEVVNELVLGTFLPPRPLL